jgi:hypothetical protein
MDDSPRRITIIHGEVDQGSVIPIHPNKSQLIIITIIID